MSGPKLIHVGERMLVEIWTLEPYGRRMADIYLLDEEAHQNFWERRYIEGRLYGRVGARRYTKADEKRIVQGEHALAEQTLRQAGVKARRIVRGRGWL